MRACCAARGPSSKTIRSPHFMYGMVSEDSTIEAQRTYRALLSASTGGSLMKDHACNPSHPSRTRASVSVGPGRQKWTQSRIEVRIGLRSFWCLCHVLKRPKAMSGRVPVSGERSRKEAPAASATERIFSRLSPCQTRHCSTKGAPAKSALKRQVVARAFALLAASTAIRSASEIGLSKLVQFGVGAAI